MKWSFLLAAPLAAFLFGSTDAYALESRVETSTGSSVKSAAGKKSSAKKKAGKKKRKAKRKAKRSDDAEPSGGGSIEDPLASDYAKGASPDDGSGPLLYRNGSGDDAASGGARKSDTSRSKSRSRDAGAAPRGSRPAAPGRAEAGKVGGRIGAVPAEETADLCKEYYPRSRRDIKESLDRILDGAAAGQGVGAEVVGCCNLVNAYRYLCGLSADVKPDDALTQRAEAFIADASAQGRADGSLQMKHQCNIILCSPGDETVEAFNASFSDVAVPKSEQCAFRGGYMVPGLKAIGVARGPVTSAEHCVAACVEAGPAPVRKAWTMPGEGFFPAQYLQGRIWSLYTDGHLGVSLHTAKVRVWKLAERPTAPLDPDKMPEDAVPVEVRSVNGTDRGVDFEPVLPEFVPGEPNIYAVSVSTRATRPGADGREVPVFEHFYIVDLF